MYVYIYIYISYIIYIIYKHLGIYALIDTFFFCPDGSCWGEPLGHLPAPGHGGPLCRGAAPAAVTWPHFPDCWGDIYIYILFRYIHIIIIVIIIIVIIMYIYIIKIYLVVFFVFFAFFFVQRFFFWIWINHNFKQIDANVEHLRLHSSNREANASNTVLANPGLGSVELVKRSHCWGRCSTEGYLKANSWGTPPCFNTRWRGSLKLCMVRILRFETGTSKPRCGACDSQLAISSVPFSTRFVRYLTSPTDFLAVSPEKGDSFSFLANLPRLSRHPENISVSHIWGCKVVTNHLSGCQLFFFLAWIHHMIVRPQFVFFWLYDNVYHIWLLKPQYWLLKSILFPE